MSTKVMFVNKQTCTGLLESVLRQATEGVKFPVGEGEAIVAQLMNCLSDNFISQSQYDELVSAILRVDRSGSIQRE